MTVLRSRNGRLSLRIRRRTLLVCGAIVVALLVVSALNLVTGSYPLSLGEVLSSLVGSNDGAAGFIITSLRLPRLLTALFVGAALAVSGAILQNLSGNPLGSPDIIGFTTGAATGALVVIVVLGGGMLTVAVGALVGGVVTALLIYLIAFTSGLHGYRFVLTGIGINAMALAVNSYLITRANLQDAMTAKAWLVGSLNGRGWTQVLAVGVTVAVLLPLAGYLSNRLTLLQLGDDLAGALGVNISRSKLALVVVSVVAAAVATAATGPIAFVALAAPQLARGLTRSSGPGILPAALLGALLLAASDLGLELLLPEAELPVGVATGTVGGCYLIWLLATKWHRGARAG